MSKIDLFEFDALGLILIGQTGVTYTNQVGGLGCFHPEIEGAFVPLFDGVGHPVLYALTQHFRRGGWHAINDTDADIIDGILRRSRLGFILTYRQSLAESYEAWVFVNVREDAQEASAAMLSGFDEQKGVLTWQNSD